MTESVPHISTSSETSVSIAFLQLDIDSVLAEYYDYVVAYKTKDSADFVLAMDSQEQHDAMKQVNTLITSGLRGGTEYTFRIQPFRKILDFVLQNPLRQPGSPSKEIIKKLPKNFEKLPKAPTETAIDMDYETTTESTTTESSNDKSGGSGLSAGDIAGLVIGVLVALHLAIGMMVGGAWYLCKQRDNNTIECCCCCNNSCN